MISKLMKAVATWPLWAPRATIAVCALLTVVSLIFIPRLHVSTDRNLLAGKESPEFKRREEVSRMFGTTLVGVVVLSGPSAQAVHRAAIDLARRIGRHPTMVKEVFYRADMDFFEQHALMFAPLDVVRQVADTLSGDTLDWSVLEQSDDLVALLENGVASIPEMGMPQDADDGRVTRGLGFINQVLVDFGVWAAGDQGAPPAFVGRLWKKAAALQGKQGASVSDEGFLGDNDGKKPALAVLFVQPAKDSQAMEVVSPFTDLLRHAAAQTTQSNAQVTSYVTGMPALQTDELRLVTRDCLVAGIVAGLGVVLVFLLAFRSFRVTLFVLLPLGVGLVWSAGFTGAVFGHLTMITSYFAAVLFGLGVAFTIHLLARFHEALLAGEDKRTAIESAMVGAGPGIVVGGATTALAFLAIVFSEFKGFAEMGVISGVGVTLILLANLTLLPAALLLWHPGVDVVVVPKSGGRFYEWVAGSRVVVPVVGVMLFVAGLLLVPKIRFNYAVESMLPQKSEAVAGIKLLNERTDFSSTFSISVADSIEEARALSRRFAKLSTVARVESIDQFLPADQQAKRTVLSGVDRALVTRLKKLAEKFQAGINRTEGVSAKALADALEELGYTFDDLALDASRGGRHQLVPFLQRIGKSAAKAAGQMAKAGDERVRGLHRQLWGLFARGLTVLSGGLGDTGFGLSDLPPTVRGRYVSRDGKHFAVIVFPKGDIGQKSFFYRHVAQLLSVDPEITGHPVIHKRFTEMVHRGFVQAVVLALLAVVVLVVLDLRRPMLLLLALGPVVLSAGWTALTMALTGFQLNYANLMALPILIGTAVDYGVHLAHRTKQGGSVRQAVRTTGRAIFLSGVTTLIGFGSLLVGNHYGVQSLGILLVMGIGFALVAALSLMPGLFSGSKERTR